MKLDPNVIRYVVDMLRQLADLLEAGLGHPS